MKGVLTQYQSDINLEKLLLSQILLLMHTFFYQKFVKMSC